MTEILHHPHQRHNIDVGGRGGLHSTTAFLYNLAPLLAYLGGGARFLPSTVPLFEALRHLVANSSKTYHKREADTLTMVAGISTAAWKATSAALRTGYGNALRTMLSKAWKDCASMSDGIAAMEPFTKPFEFANFATLINFEDTATMEDEKRAHTMRTESCNTWRVTQTVLTQGPSGDVMPVEMIAAVLRFGQQHMRLPPQDAWSVSSNFNTQFTPTATTYSEAQTAHIDVSYMRKKIIGGCWNACHALLNKIIDDPMCKLEHTAFWSIVASFKQPAMRARVRIGDADLTPATELCRRVQEVQDAFLPLYNTATNDNVSGDLLQLSFRSNRDGGDSAL